MSDTQETPNHNWSISLGTLTTVAVCLLLGAAGAEIIRNIAGAEKLSFSTTELIGFVLSVVLSAASIVLAIAAIWMGKVTELAIIRRSDESIRLQNEVFVRTTEALQRIEASTGVTEKRIEDIIQGRVGDLSHKIADIAAGRTGLMRDRASLEDQIRQSILETVRSDRPKKDEIPDEARKKLEERAERYKSFHQALLNAFSNRPNTSTTKLGDGKYKGEGESLFDVIALIDGKKVGASALSRNAADDSDFTAYIALVGRAIVTNVVQYVVFAIDSDSSEHQKYLALIESTLSALKGDPQNRIKVICSDASSLAEAVQAISP